MYRPTLPVELHAMLPPRLLSGVYPVHPQKHLKNLPQ